MRAALDNRSQRVKFVCQTDELTFTTVRAALFMLLCTIDSDNDLGLVQYVTW
jgi:hypothetical protein